MLFRYLVDNMPVTGWFQAGSVSLEEIEYRARIMNMHSNWQIEFR